MDEELKGINECISDPEVSNYGIKHIISIKEMDRGYIVQVGCKSFAFEDTMTMLGHLEDYLVDKKGIESKFNKGELWK